MSAAVQQHKSRIGGAVKAGNRGLEEQARAALKAAKAEDYIRKLVDEAPPLTESQRSALASLLRSGGGAKA